MSGYVNLDTLIGPAAFSQYASDPRWEAVNQMLAQLFADVLAAGLLFNNSVSANLNSGSVYSDFDPSGYVAGTTNRLDLTPTGANRTLDGLTAPGEDGFPLYVYNPSLSYSLVLLDNNFTGNGSSAGNKFACSNPNGLSANAIETAIPPQSGLLLIYNGSVWTMAS